MGRFSREYYSISYILRETATEVLILTRVNWMKVPADKIPTAALLFGDPLPSVAY